MICDMGLSEHDFQFLGIRNPLHQSVLTASSKPGYSEGVRVSVTDKRKFDSAVVYVVVSRYKFYRSTIYLRYTDFRNFDTKIRRLVKQQLPGLASPIPNLPGQGASLEESKDNKSQELKMQSFEIYLNAVSLLLHGTSPFRTLLEFLYLQSA